MKKKGCFIGLFIFVAFLSAQPAIEWQKTFGGTNSDRAESVQQTLDGGYILAGGTTSNDGDVFGNHGGIDFWIVKMDSLGSAQWKKAYGGSDNEQAYSIRQTTDKGYIVAGFTLSNDGDVSGNHGFYDAWVLKLDSVGAIQWQKALGGSGWEEAWSVNQTTDGGYIISGWSTSSDGDVTINHGSFDYWIVKLDNFGNIEWQRSHGGSDEDLSYAVQPTTDGGYIVSGESESNDGNVTGNHGSSDYWVLKLNYDGKIEWEKSLGGTSLDRANDIRQTRDGGFIVFGQVYSNNGDVTGHHGYNDLWVVKLSDIGEIVWQKALGGSNEDFATSIYQTSDGGYAMTGQTQSNNGDVPGNDGGADLWVLKLTEAGEIEWQKSLGGTLAEWGSSIQQTNDNGYILTGYAWSNNGDVSGVQGKTDYWIVKLSPEFSGTEESSILPLQISPNPTQQSITLNIPTLSAVVSTEAGQETNFTICITNLLGQQLHQQIISNGEPINTSALPNGAYLINATTSSGKIYTGKFIKQN